MAKLIWDKVGERLYETGVDKVVLYVQEKNGTYGKGVAWNGVTGVTESPSGAEATAIYADNAKYLSLISAEELGVTIEAYMSPEEFDACDGVTEIADGITLGQQTRQKFGLCFRTKIGNDTEDAEHGYKLHIIYNCTASPSEKGYTTVNESPEAMTLSWSVSTNPIDAEGHKPTALVVIDSTKVKSEILKAIEDKLYGTETEEPTLLTPAEIAELVKTTVAA